MNEFTFPCEFRPVVQLGIGDSRIDQAEVGQWNIDDWNDPLALWAGSNPFWNDITGRVFELECTLGRQRATDLFDPGKATLLADNADGWGDPIPPDDNPAFLTLRAGRPIRIGLDHDTIGTRWIWRGFIDATEPLYDANDFEQVSISAVCALGEVGRTPLAELAVAVGANELAGTRITRILNVAKWPNAARSIDTTGVTMLATVLGDQAADLLAITAESVGGAVYGDENGRVVFRGRDWQLYPPDEPVAWTVGNHVGGDEAFNPPTQTATGVWDWDDAYFTELSPGVWEWIGV